MFLVNVKSYALLPFTTATGSLAMDGVEMFNCSVDVDVSIPLFSASFLTIFESPTIQLTLVYCILNWIETRLLTF